MGIDIEVQETEAEIISNKYALLIGVQDFEDKKIPSLRGVIKDIEKFNQILSDPTFSKFKVNTLINPALVESRKAISEISLNANENDVVFFYYSGHGLLDNHRSLFLLYRDSESDFKDATCMESEYILSQFRKSKCKNFIIIIDACHSGAFFNNNRGLPNGLVALTACDESQTTYETLEGGIFSNILIKGLKSDYIDANRDGIITFSELFEYIIEQIKLNTTYSSTPKKWEWNVDKDIYLFSSPRPVFISYQRKQKELVKRISKTLQKEDISTFVDQEKIRIGDNWRELLEKSIKNSRVFLYVMDNDILFSDVANWELETAHNFNVPILPIMVEEIKVHAMFEKIYGHYNRLVFDNEDFDNSMQIIIDHIKSLRVKQKITNTEVPKISR
ncbi:MAG: caspase family protein [Spirosoma sp.]|nr:caspase family protein [Spirosoma sp.]